jgi:hypothetical protein
MGRASGKKASKTGYGNHPFIYPTTEENIWSWYEVIKCAIMTVLLIPVIRLILFQLLCAIAGSVGYLANLGWKKYDDQGNVRLLPRWRRKIVEIAFPVLSRMVLFSLGFYRPKYRGVSHFGKICLFSLTFY